MIYIIGLIGILAGLVIHQWVKKNSVEALLTNTEVKEKIAEKDGAISANTALIKSEEDKQKELEAKMKEEQAKGNSNEELTTFFGSYFKRNK